MRAYGLHAYQNGRQFTALLDLFDGISKMREAIILQYVCSLYQSIPTRLFVVVKSIGKLTDYQVRISIFYISSFLFFRSGVLF